MKPDKPVARRSDYTLTQCSHQAAVEAVERWHYAEGAANTSVAAHCLFRNGEVVGVALWMPPTPQAQKSVAASLGREDWKNVLALSRLVVKPGEPQNAAGMLLAGSMRRLPGRWRTLVTYADTRQGHSGTVYKATNWVNQGLMRGAPTFVDAEGKQVSQKRAGVTRTVAQMKALGYRYLKAVPKWRFVFAR